MSWTSGSFSKSQMKAVAPLYSQTYERRNITASFSNDRSSRNFLQWQMALFKVSLRSIAAGSSLSVISGSSSSTFVANVTLRQWSVAWSQAWWMYIYRSCHKSWTLQPFIQFRPNSALLSNTRYLQGRNDCARIKVCLRIFADARPSRYRRNDNKAVVMVAK